MHKRISRPAAAAKPSWDFVNPEVDQLIADLKQQKEKLAARETELDQLELRLKAEREEIGVVTQQVAKMQSEIDRSLVRVREEESANLKRLAKIYGNMSPDGAVSILKEMKDDDVVRILVYMKYDQTAPILELLARAGATDAKRAAQISERLKAAVYRTPANPTS